MNLTLGMILVLASAVLQSVGNLLMRAGVRDLDAFSLAPARLIGSLISLGTQPLFAAGLVFYVTSAVLWFRVISLEDLTTAYPILVGSSFVVVTLGAVTIFDENVNMAKAFGIILILSGVALVSMAKA